MSVLPVLNCESCGKCCQHMGFPPFMYFEILDLPNVLKQPLLEVYDNKQVLEEGGLSCIWLKDNQCMHYRHRPQICRDFELGSDACIKYRNS